MAMNVLSHLNHGLCMKKHHPAPLQKTNLHIHVPMWILIAWNELYPFLSRSLKLMIM